MTDNKIHDLLMEKTFELATANVIIIENEAKKACEKFNCTSDDLIVEYHGTTEITIKVKASRFKIENIFHCDGEIVIDNMKSMDK